MKINNFQENFEPIETIGDGSCLLHAILQGYNKKYIESDDLEKIKTVKNLRNDLADSLQCKENNMKKTIYQNLSRGEIEEISKFVIEMDIRYMSAYLRTNNWLSIHYLELVVNLLDINVFIIDQSKKNFYLTGDNEIYFKKRDSVFINYIEDTHFETMAVKTKHGYQTFFSYESKIIQKCLKIMKII